MPLTRADFLPGSRLHMEGGRCIGYFPMADTDLYLTDAGGGGDPQLLVVGTELIGGVIATGPTPPNCGVTFSLTDTVGTSATMSFLVTGENQFGTVVSETVAVPNSGTQTVPSRVHTVNAYRRITSIVVTVNNNTTNADLLEVGFSPDSDSNRIPLGLPVRLRTSAQLGAACQLVPITAMGTRRAVSLLSASRATYVLTNSAGITGGLILELRFDVTNPEL